MSLDDVKLVPVCDAAKLKSSSYSLCKASCRVIAEVSGPRLDYKIYTDFHIFYTGDTHTDRLLYP